MHYFLPSSPLAFWLYLLWLSFVKLIHCLRVAGIFINSIHEHFACECCQQCFMMTVYWSAWCPSEPVVPWLRIHCVKQAVWYLAFVEVEGRSCMMLLKLFWIVLPDSKSASQRSAWWATGLILIFSLGRMVAAKLCLSSLVLYNWFSFYYCTSSEYYHFSIVLLYMDWDKELVSLSYKFSQVFLVLCRSNNSGDTPKPWQLHPAWCLHKPDIWSSFCQESCQCLNSNRSNRMFGAY